MANSDVDKQQILLITLSIGEQQSSSSSSKSIQTDSNQSAVQTPLFDQNYLNEFLFKDDSIKDLFKDLLHTLRPQLPPPLQTRINEVLTQIELAENTRNQKQMTELRQIREQKAFQEKRGIILDLFSEYNFRKQRIMRMIENKGKLINQQIQIQNDNIISQNNNQNMIQNPNNLHIPFMTSKYMYDEIMNMMEEEGNYEQIDINRYHAVQQAQNASICLQAIILKGDIYARDDRIEQDEDDEDDETTNIDIDDEEEEYGLMSDDDKEDDYGFEDEFPQLNQDQVQEKKRKDQFQSQLDQKINERRNIMEKDIKNQHIMEDEQLHDDDNNSQITPNNNPQSEKQTQEQSHITPFMEKEISEYLNEQTISSIFDRSVEEELEKESVKQKLREIEKKKEKQWKRERLIHNKVINKEIDAEDVSSEQDEDEDDQLDELERVKDQVKDKQEQGSDQEEGQSGTI